MIKKISHIAIVVPKLDEAMGFWGDALGLDLGRPEHVPDQGVNVVFMPVGASDIELLEPINSTSGVARYLEKRGPGIHHICFEVDDMEATLARLKAANVPLINEEPTLSADGNKIAFIHPKGTNGVLVELYEVAAKAEDRETEMGEVRRRLQDGRQAYTAARTFFSRRRNDETEENDGVEHG